MFVERLKNLKADQDEQKLQKFLDFIAEEDFIKA
jgi:hypothetical protein